jgi:hypothetical protein
MARLFEFGDKVKVDHAVEHVGGRFGVVMRTGPLGAWVLFFDQSEAHVEWHHLRGPSDAEWWGFMRGMTA